MLSWFRKKEPKSPEVIPQPDLRKDAPETELSVNDPGQLQSPTNTVVQSEHSSNIAPSPQDTTPTLTTATSKQSGIFSWLWRSDETDSMKEPLFEKLARKPVPVYDNEEKNNEEINEHFSELPSLSNAELSYGSEERDFTPDPEVVAFFQDFPEYYREKAIRRFSSRKGFMRYDFYRRWCMQEERAQALQGKFPEARRERRAEYEEQMELRRLEGHEDYIKELRNRHEEKGVPEWEKFVLQYFPLQEGETMKWKLFGAVSLSAFGFSLLHQGFTYRQRYPKQNLGFGKWRLVGSGVSGILGMISFQYFTYLRLYDKGYFDNTVDSRGVLEKIATQAEQDFEDYLDVFLDFMDSPTGKAKS